MALLRNIKTRFGIRALARTPEPNRERHGSNFGTAQKVGFLFLDADESSYNTVKQFLKNLKDKYDIRTVRALAFIDLAEKHVPVYQSHKLEMDFITRDDLNWYYKPIKSVTPFVREEFDLLIDLSGGDVLPLSFIFKESMAHMKVAPNDGLTSEYADLIFDMGVRYDSDRFMEQLNTYLSNSRIV